MYSSSLRAAASSTGLGFALGRLGGTSGGAAGAVAAAPGFAIPSRGGRSVSATSAAGAPEPGDQGVGMEPPKQEQPQIPPQDLSRGGEEEKNTRVYTHKAHHWDVMTHPFGEGYATRSDEEGFGGVYGRNDDDPAEHAGTEIHPGHPEYDTTQGSEVKEKEKARHCKDEKLAT